MPKRVLTQLELFDLRLALQIATLDALMSGRRWQPGELVFQGGTSLHLVHGSPRFSEDLDFLLASDLNADIVERSVRERLRGARWIPSDTELTVSRLKDARNPRSFTISVGGPDVIGAARVNVELFQTDRSTLKQLRVVVSPVQVPSGPVSGMQVFVPTADLSEIYADKVFALAVRPYLKPRDVFDLYWLQQRGPWEVSAKALEVRLATYPVDTPATYVEKALKRRAEIPDAQKMISKDLRRWLPTAWSLTEIEVQAMVKSSVAALDQSVAIMRKLAPELAPNPSKARGRGR